MIRQPSRATGSLKTRSQKSLFQCRIHLRDAVLEEGSLFPFFDRRGKVHAYMLIWRSSPQIVMLDARESLITGSRPLQLDVSFGELQDLRSDRFDRYHRLWHFDPWWALGDERYGAHPAVPVLKASNVVAHLGALPFPGRFSNDLRRVVGRIDHLLPMRPSSRHSGGKPLAAKSWSFRSTWPGLR